MKGKKNKITEEVILYNNINELSVNYSGEDWTKLNDTQTAEEWLKKSQNQKIKDLEAFYATNDVWLITLQDNQGNTLTRSQEWFLMRITSNIELIDNKGNLIQKTLPNPDAVKTVLNNKGLEIFQWKLSMQKKINNTKTIEELEAINFEENLKEIDKVIII